MTVSLWRIATDTATYVAEDLGGEGAKITGGRWNRPGTPVVYCATNKSLAALETIVHLGATGLPLNRYLVRVDVPARIWNTRHVHPGGVFPVGWDSLPAGKVSLDLGDDWLRGCTTALFEVPSVIVPDESNILINPNHPKAAKIRATKVRKWTYDGRLRP